MKAANIDGVTGCSRTFFRLDRTKTASREDQRVLAVGRPVEAPGISSGPVFRPIDRWGAIDDSASTDRASTQSSRRVAVSPGSTQSSSPRTTCAPATSPRPPAAACRCPRAMRQSRHRSLQQAAAYYNEVEIERGRTAQLV
jgi:hypothetical protein